MPSRSGTDSSWTVFKAFLKLGLTSFGGPVAHLGYFRHEFVERRRWLGEHAYADLVALCQFLPGPASSQVGMALGLSRAGLPGALAAWLGFTLPSAILMVLFGLGLSHWGAGAGSGWLHGLKLAAVAVVAQAVWAMGRKLAPDRSRAALASLAALVVLAFPGSWSQIAVLLAAGLFGSLWLESDQAAPEAGIQSPLGPAWGGAALLLFLVLLVGLPILAQLTGIYVWRLVSGFYQAGSLVFGGGHVVLPLLQAQVVPTGWLSNESFLAGYGAAQAVPGPLFSFAAYLGAVSLGVPSGWLGAGIAQVAILLPSFLLVVGALPFWDRLRRITLMRRAVLGINAAVVGILLAALYHPVWTAAVLSGVDFALAVGAFVALEKWKAPSWLVVLALAVAGGLGGRL